MQGSESLALCLQRACVCFSFWLGVDGCAETPQAYVYTILYVHDSEMCVNICIGLLGM